MDWNSRGLQKMVEEGMSGASGLQPTLRERVELRKKQAQEEIAKANEVLQLLEGLPEVDKLLNLLGRSGY